MTSGVDEQTPSLSCSAECHERHAEAAAQIEHLTVALTNARHIGAALGILMATHGVTNDAAFELLSVTSQNRNMKLRDVAERVLYTGTLPG